MSRRWLVAAVLSALLVVLGGLLASDGVTAATGGGNTRAALIGYQEVPAVSTQARGQFRARISNDKIEYELEYSGLEGTVTQAHIHFAQRGVNGGIAVWLCQTATNADPTGLAPTCPAPGGKVTGALTAANVIGPTGQGIAAGEFAEFLRALRSGVTYANVHSSKFPGGEIRAQLHLGGHLGQSDDD
jgi:hypothetical protein